VDAHLGPRPAHTHDGVKIDIDPGRGAPTTHLTVNDTVVKYEPFFEADGTKKTLVYVRGIVHEARTSGGPTPDNENPLITTEMEDLCDEWAHCQKCELHKHRTQVVFGDGNQRDPKILIVGEAPGPDEDKHGRPFIGRTGQKLRNTLKMVGIDVDRDCYITNAVCCYPYDEETGKFRGPKGSEVIACRPRLVAQASIIKPSIRVVLCLGKRAFATFARAKLMGDGGLESTKDWDAIKIKSELGWYTGPGSEKMKVKMYTTYHPSFIARQNQSRARAVNVAWQLDLKAVADYALKGEYTDPRVVKP